MVELKTQNRTVANVGVRGSVLVDPKGFAQHVYDRFD